MTFHGVTKAFSTGNLKKQKPLVAVDQFNLAVEQGELVVLLGPSGCGKTTLLRMIAGLEEVDHGEITLNGENIASIPPSQRPFAMVFQNYALYPHMTARENLTYALRARRVPKVEIAHRLSEIASLVRLQPEELDRKPAKLSGGQQQRVAFGRALMTRPSVLLLDEPFSNLDQHLRMHVRIQLRKIQKKLRLTVIMVTHDHDEAAALGDRIVLMNRGRIEQHGNPESLFNTPESLFAAKFMGFPTMNFIRGKITLHGREGKKRFQESGNGSITLPLENPIFSQLPVGEDLILGMRPQYVFVKPFKEKNDETPMHGSGLVLDEERCGMDRYLHMDTGSHVISGRIEEHRIAGTPLGDTRAFIFKTDGILFFHPSTEKRLFP